MPSKSAIISSREPYRIKCILSRRSISPANLLMEPSRSCLVRGLQLCRSRSFIARGFSHFFFGTFAPFFRASESPIAIACLRLVTLPPFPPLPERSVPLFSRCIALSTLLLAALPYFAIIASVRTNWARTLCFYRAPAQQHSANADLSVERYVGRYRENRSLGSVIPGRHWQAIESSRHVLRNLRQDGSKQRYKLALDSLPCFHHFRVVNFAINDPRRHIGHA